jgi:hypothetical protein
MKRYQAKTILATEFGWDTSDLEDYRYHHGRTNKPIYAIGQEYFCAVKIDQKPAKHDTIEFNWEKYNSSFATSNGWQIWVVKGE